MRMFPWETLNKANIDVADVLKSFVDEKLAEGKKVNLDVFHYTFRELGEDKGPPGLKAKDKLPNGAWFLRYSYTGTIEDPWNIHLAGQSFTWKAELRDGNSEFIYRFFEPGKEVTGGRPDYGELMLVMFNHKGMIVYDETETHEYFSAGFPPTAVWKVIASEKVFTDEKLGIESIPAPPEVVKDFLKSCKKARERSGTSKIKIKVH